VSGTYGSDTVWIPTTYPIPVNGFSPETAVSQSFGLGVSSDSLPHIDIVIRRDIIMGKDINLASRLIPGFKSESSSTRHLVQGDEVIQLKPLSDSRLSRSLTLSEFIMAFSIYTNVMCEA
jgi:hypothetical protein